MELLWEWSNRPLSPGFRIPKVKNNLLEAQNDSDRSKEEQTGAKMSTADTFIESAVGQEAGSGEVLEVTNYFQLKYNNLCRYYIEMYQNVEIYSIHWV